MRGMKFVCVALAMWVGAVAWADSNYAKFGRYEESNRVVKSETNDGRRVVFMGNSITDEWPKHHPGFFSENGFIGRGISGQASYEMLSRFREDVVNLKPAGVVICAGTNDIAQNLYDRYDEERTMGNIASMAEIAKSNGIRVFLASVPPVTKFDWNESVTDIQGKINRLNERIREYAVAHDCEYVDYFSELVTDGDIMNPEFSKDGVHPNGEGYVVMERVVTPIIRKHIR